MLDLNPGHGKVTRIARGEPGIRSVHINSAKRTHKGHGAALLLAGLGAGIVRRRR